MEKSFISQSPTLSARPGASQGDVGATDAAADHEQVERRSILRSTLGGPTHSPA